MSNLQEGRTQQVKGHNWFEGGHSLLEGCCRLLLGGHILLGLGLVWGTVEPQGWVQGHMVTHLGRLETALGEGHRGWEGLERLGNQQGVG